MLLRVLNGTFSLFDKIGEAVDNSTVSLLNELEETFLRGVGEVEGLDYFGK